MFFADDESLNSKVSKSTQQYVSIENIYIYKHDS